MNVSSHRRRALKFKALITIDFDFLSIGWNNENVGNDRPLSESFFLCAWTPDVISHISYTNILNIFRKYLCPQASFWALGHQIKFHTVPTPNQRAQIKRQALKVHLRRLVKSMLESSCCKVRREQKIWKPISWVLLSNILTFILFFKRSVFDRSLWLHCSALKFEQSPSRSVNSCRRGASKVSLA